MYAMGWGVKSDIGEAVNWIRKAADQGDAPAQYTLGMMYGDGNRIMPDYVQAYMWVSLAAAKFEGKAQDEATKLRDQIAKKMTREQIAEAQRLAREWKPKQAK